MSRAELAADSSAVAVPFATAPLWLSGAPRVAFAGTPEFAAIALQALHAAGACIPLVLTQPDRPAGRGMKLTPSAVKQVAQRLALPVAQPRGLRLDGKFAEDAQSAQAAMRSAAPDVLVVAAYGLILPPWVLALPRWGCLNIHASLLPRWRGAAPIHRAIEGGDAESGVTIMQMDAGLDTGAMLSVERTPVQSVDTTGTLHDRLAEIGARLIVQAVADAQQGALRPLVQPEQGVTYAQKIAKSEAAIDWTQDAALLERRVRAFNPLPGAHFQWQGDAIKLWRAAVVDPPPAAAAAPGTVLEANAARLIVACGRGALSLEEVQRPGGKRQPIAAWLHAHAVPVGTRLVESN